MSPTPKSGGSPRRLDPRDKQLLVGQLRRDAEVIAANFKLTYKSLEAENARVRARYGSFDSDGVIKIRLTHARTGRPLKYSSMVDTLCHELAHTKHFHHGIRFKALYEKILAWARDEGIYRPTPRGEPRPETLRDLPSGTPVGVAAARVAPAPRKRARPKRPAAPPRRELEQLRLF